jgi:Fic family protein
MSKDESTSSQTSSTSSSQTSTSSPRFAPRFQITAAITKALMGIEADRQAILELPIDVTLLASLRETAKLIATHYSTQIEGNRLTQVQVKEALGGANFPGRERDEREVRHYYRALEEVERLAQDSTSISEQDIQRIHGLVMEGRPTPTVYRDGQNAIYDSKSGAIVYLPPERVDVPNLMAQLVAWIEESILSNELPVPLIAALAHYQFATIHPYYDGNGRTARLLTTLILHKAGYGLKGIYSLEEYYAQNLEGYYNALAVTEEYNYYSGRAEADVTGFVFYFCEGMAHAFSAVRNQAVQASRRGASDQSALLRQLGPRERRLLEMFRTQSTATTEEIAKHLALSPRTVHGLCATWITSGFLIIANPARKSRLYRLSATYESLMTG